MPQFFDSPSQGVKPVSSANDLIFDVGMNNGDDTAFYLACGYRVVAVEADPTLIESAQERFKVEIEAGKLTLLNVAIAEQPGTADFWVNEFNRGWSSFSKSRAERGGGYPFHAISVSCRRLDDILAEYGVPHYLKIDIEGYDLVCCRQLVPENKPEYISVEMSQFELLLSLRDLGYERFKLIDQSNFKMLDAQEPNLRERLLTSLYWTANDNKQDRRLHRKLVRAGAASVLSTARKMHLWDYAEPLRSRLVPDWKFVQQMSGTFGRDLPGKWLSWDEVAYSWIREWRVHQRRGTEIWVDLHATGPLGATGITS